MDVECHYHFFMFLICRVLECVVYEAAYAHCPLLPPKPSSLLFYMMKLGDVE